MSTVQDALLARLAQAEHERDVARRIAEAMARIARRINAHPGDLEGNLDEICNAAAALTDSTWGFAWLLDGEVLRSRGTNMDPRTYAALPPEAHVQRLDSFWPVAISTREGRTFVAEDWARYLRDHGKTKRERSDEYLQHFEALGTHAVMAAPLGSAPCIGAITVLRADHRPYDDAEVALLEGFAAQAATAVETARTQQVLTDSLARESAIAEVLQAISRTAFDLDVVLGTLIQSAVQLLNGRTGVLFLHRGDVIEPVGFYPPAARETLNRPLSASEVLPLGMSLQAHEPFSLFVTRSNRAIPNVDIAVDNFGEHSILLAPIVRHGQSIGLVTVDHPGEVTYRPDQVALLRTFADQAGIAIENARLLGDLNESNQRSQVALERQTAMAEVLQAISRSVDDTAPVFEHILDGCERLFGTDQIALVLVDEHGLVHANALRGETMARLMSVLPLPLEQTSTGWTFRERRPLHVPDISAFPDPPESMRRAAELFGTGSILFAPMLQGEQGIGSIALVRHPPRPFTDAEIDLLGAFADQAVIAVQNARMFAALQARNREVSEALRREEASSEILRQISNAPEALDDTLKTIADAARRLTGMSSVVLLPDEDGQLIIRGLSRIEGEIPTRVLGNPSLISGTREAEQFMKSRDVLIFGKEALATADWARGRDRDVLAAAFVPIRRGDMVLGLLVVTSDTENPITPQIGTLLQSFADQAAIAIENARLIRELRESNRAISENLDVQRVMGNVLSIVAAAPTDLDITLPQIAAAARQLCDAQIATVHWIDGDQLHTFDGGTSEAVRPFDPEWARTSLMGASAMEKREIEIAAPLEELAAQYPYTAAISRSRPVPATHVNALAVPMQGRGESVGAISVWRNNMTGYTERQRTVLRTLATQAVVAIENARLFRQLQTKTEELEVASRHKSEFLANMSHELRTPLNAIIGYAELLQEECEDLGQEDFLPDLGKIHSAGRHLLTLISGILDLSKVEAGRMTMFLEDFDIATLIRDADAIVRPLVEKNRNRFVIDCPEGIGTMHADLVKVRQVLFNLLSNSAKFTEGGEIALTVRAHPETSTVTFAIRDTGIGMTEEQLGRLFEAFSQANAETSRKYGGTGLGLALSREFCRMMGGDITVESAHGAGSTFTVTLPVTCVDPGAAA